MKRFGFLNLDQRLAGSLATSDLLDKLWGWDRLLAYDLHFEFEDPSDMPMYESYLDKFYASNDHHNNAADAILKVITSPCLPQPAMNCEFF